MVDRYRTLAQSPTVEIEPVQIFTEVFYTYNLMAIMLMTIFKHCLTVVKLLEKYCDVPIYEIPFSVVLNHKTSAISYSGTGI